MTKRYSVDYLSPIGVLEIEGTDQMITSILFSEKKDIENDCHPNLPSVLIKCYNELDEYFKGNRKVFTFPYEMKGTDFQKNVWNALTEIPYAETGSYKDISMAIGNEKAVRAVGSANGKNKLSIVVPCHRIIGSSGKLTGYAGGLWRKEWLLRHERSHN